MTDSASSPYKDVAWCFSTLGCPSLSLSEITALARRFSIPQVELRSVSDRMDLPKLLEEQFGSPGELHSWLEKERVRIGAFDSSAKLIGCSEEARDELLAFAEWAHGAGVPGIRVFDGGETAPQLPREDRDEAVEFLEWWESHRSKNNWSVDIIVETHDALCNTEPCLDLAKASGRKLLLLWDAHHTWRKGGEDPLKTWPSIQTLVRHIHVKDSLSKPSENMPYTYVSPGKGDFGLENLLNRLREDGFRGPVSLEWERKWIPELAPLEEVLQDLEALRQ